MTKTDLEVWEYNAKRGIGTPPKIVLELIIEVKRLEKEADWLASNMPKILACEGSRKVVTLKGPEQWREQARKAVGGINEPRSNQS